MSTLHEGGCGGFNSQRERKRHSSLGESSLPLYGRGIENDAEPPEECRCSIEVRMKRKRKRVCLFNFLVNNNKCVYCLFELKLIESDLTYCI